MTAAAASVVLELLLASSFIEFECSIFCLIFLLIFWKSMPNLPLFVDESPDIFDCESLIIKSVAGFTECLLFFASSVGCCKLFRFVSK